MIAWILVPIRVCMFNWLLNKRGNNYGHHNGRDVEQHLTCSYNNEHFSIKRLPVSRYHCVNFQAQGFIETLLKVPNLRSWMMQNKFLLSDASEVKVEANCFEIQQ